jgi:D-3-phosphoglycerate dehydrogenase
MNVVVLGNIRESGLSLLRDAADIKLLVVDPFDHEAVCDHVAKADAILVRISPLTADQINRAERLKVVSRHGVGVDNIDVDVLTRRGIPVAAVGEINAVSVAEHTLHLIPATMNALRADLRAAACPRDGKRAADMDAAAS